MTEPTPTAGTEHRPPRRQARGAVRRTAIVRAAADLILREGPTVVTHRAVAAHADVPLAATTYYFTGLDELVAEAGRVIVEGWAAHARDVAGRAPEQSGTDRGAGVLVDAVLPPGGEAEVRGFYEHLVGAGRHPVLARAYADGRHTLDAAVAHVLATLGAGGTSPGLVVAVVDGAVLSALSEGRDARDHARGVVVELLRAVGPEGR
jgi:DNA-binding transcriptional regulator YbjK